MHLIMVEPRYVEAQGPPLATGVSFARIDPGDWKLPQDNQRVSNSVFQRSPIIIVVGKLDIGYRWTIGILEFSEFFSTMPHFYAKKHTTFVVKDWRLQPECPFYFPSILLHKALDQGETPLGWSARTPSFRQGIICQDWSSSFEVTFGQPQGVKPGI